jgi:hypothetical protein
MILDHFAGRFAFCFVLYGAGLPLLESIPSEFHPSEGIFKYLILPFITAVLIPALNRITTSVLDRLLPSPYIKPKHEDTEEETEPEPPAMEQTPKPNTK